MWMGGVDVPQELIDAHQRGELVIFVGAGASMSAPSNLPDFNVSPTDPRSRVVAHQRGELASFSITSHQ